MYLACEMTNMSLPEIGSAFNKDHSTVVHNRNKIREIMRDFSAIEHTDSLNDTDKKKYEIFQIVKRISEHLKAVNK